MMSFVASTDLEVLLAKLRHFENVGKVHAGSTQDTLKLL